jgi:DNA mismatch repair protein MutS2
MRLGDDFDLLLVTGPNTGGKTVMIKTVGLLTLMAQSGMHIPAHPDSRVGVYQQVFADIGDEQSIEQSLSTFSAHIGRIVAILKRTNEKTLVLLDELGAGTDPAEGAVLATAILDKLLAKRAKIVATSHLGRLKSYAYTTARAENASVQFDVQTLQPTFKVRIGTPGSSNALAIAKRLGMAQGIIRQARSQLQDDADGTSELINQVQATREDAERKRLKAQQTLDEAQQMHDQAAERLKQLKYQQKVLTSQANREIDKSMSQVRKAVDGFLAQMQNAPKPWSEHSRQLHEQISQAAAGTPLAVRQARFIESVRKGDTVYVASFRRNGIVCRLRRKRKVAAVLVEGKEVEVPFRQIWEPDTRERP